MGYLPDILTSIIYYCYKLIRMKSSYVLISCMLASLFVVLMIPSCNQPGAGWQATESEIMNAAKPAIDSSRVLETLALYRAKRYEGIQEAMKAGVDNVHKLVLHGRKMGILSPAIGSLTNLASLDVAYNELSELPDEISRLYYLQGFYANGNSLVDFPKQILLLPLLAKLDLSENQIREIPVEIVRMDQLTRLSLNKNAFTSVPVQLYELENLKVFELSDNNLSELPAGIANLSNLTKLDLANNQLTSLPKEISTLSETMNELNIQGNPIPPEEIEWLIKAMPKTKIRY